MEQRSLKSSKNQYFLGLSNTNQIEVAQAELEEEIKSEPKESSYWQTRGLVYYRQGLLDKALFCFDQAACLLPSNLEAILNGAIVLADLGFYKEANMRFKTAENLNQKAQSNLEIEENPSLLGPIVLEAVAKKFIILARELEALGLKKQSKQLIEKASKDYPCWDFFLERALLQLKEFKFNSALENIDLSRQKILDSSEKAGQTFLIACLIHLAKGDFKSAQNEYDQALQALGSDNPRLLRLVTEILENQGKSS
jgi:tetratricopeptide (TPR) repeat protein